MCKVSVIAEGEILNFGDKSLTLEFLSTTEEKNTIVVKVLNDLQFLQIKEFFPIGQKVSLMGYLESFENTFSILLTTVRKK